MKIKDKRPDERPREKLAAKGAGALTDLELLEAIIGRGGAAGDVTVLARKVLKVLKGSSLPDLFGQSSDCHSELVSESNETCHSGLDPESSRNLYKDLSRIPGLGAAKISEILAAFELSRRLFSEPDRPVIDAPEKIFDLLAETRGRKQEYFTLFTLDGANRLIAQRVITIGTLTSSLVHPREVFAPAVADRAAAIIVAHNHPSGELNPSPADREVTERLKNAGQILGINLVDHIIVTRSEWRSII